MDPLLCVLVVEDEPLILALLSEELTDAGFAVVAAKTGQEALARLDAEEPRISVLMTDVRLGKGPDGWDIGRHARERNHHIPVVYMSGDSAGDWSARGVPHSLMIGKPFVIAQVITAISTLLNENSSELR